MPQNIILKSVVLEILYLSVLKAVAIRCGSNTCPKSSAYLPFSLRPQLVQYFHSESHNATRGITWRFLVILSVAVEQLFCFSPRLRLSIITQFFPTLSYCFSTSYRLFSALTGIAANTSSFTLTTWRLDAALSHKLGRTLLLASLPIAVTFIYGRAHIDSCFLMREAFSWSVATLARSPLMARGKRTSERHRLGVSGRRLVSCCDLRMLRMHGGQGALPWNAIPAVYLLSNSKRVNQKPQWGEGRKEMDIDVKWLRVYFLLCVLASLFSVHLFAS